MDFARGTDSNLDCTIRRAEIITGLCEETAYQQRRCN